MLSRSASRTYPLAVQRLCYRSPNKCGVGWSLWPRYERAGGQLRELQFSGMIPVNVHRDAVMGIVLTLVRTYEYVR